MSFELALKLQKAAQSECVSVTLVRKLAEVAFCELPADILRIIEEYFNPTMYQIIQTFIALQHARKILYRRDFSLFVNGKCFNCLPPGFFQNKRALSARLECVKSLTFWFGRCLVHLQSHEQHVLIDKKWVDDFNNLLKHIDAFFVKSIKHNYCPEPFSIKFICETKKNENC